MKVLLLFISVMLVASCSTVDSDKMFDDIVALQKRNSILEDKVLKLNEKYRQVQQELDEMKSKMESPE